MMRILIWHQGALGDLILSLPAIRAIRRRHPGCTIHLICRPDLHGIIIFNNLADSVASHEDGGLAGFFSGPPEFTRGYLKGYTAAYVFARREGVLCETIRSHMAETVHVRTVPPEGMRVHAASYQLGQIPDGSGSEADFSALRWPAPAHYGDAKVICLHPGSGGSAKCWPMQRYIELLGYLGREGHVFRVLLGPAEDDRYAEKIADIASVLKAGVEVIRHQPLTSAASHLKSSSCYIGNDSGVTHLAGALGVPGVAIFGPTDHMVWGPWGGSVAVVSPELDCAPCGEGHRGCKDMKCLQDITVRRVAAAVSAQCRQPAVTERGLS